MITKMFTYLVLVFQVIFSSAVYAENIASASIINTKGKVIGSVKLSEMPSGVLLKVSLSELKPGAHGFHIHAGKQCNPPSFSETKGHFNPFNHPHGFKNNKEYHLGDLPNLIVSESGDVTQTVWLNDASLSKGLTNISGRTIVIHDGPDDYVSQPSGNAGKKIACGVITIID